MRHVKAALLRGGIALVIMAGISIALFATGKPDDGRSTLMVGLIIGAIGAASVVYDFDWTLAKRIGVHFLIMCVTVLPVLILSGWFPTQTPLDYLVIFGIFVATGIAILALIGLGFAIARAIRRART